MARPTEGISGPSSARLISSFSPAALALIVLGGEIVPAATCPDCSAAKMLAVVPSCTKVMSSSARPHCCKARCDATSVEEPTRVIPHSWPARSAGRSMYGRANTEKIWRLVIADTNTTSLPLAMPRTPTSTSSALASMSFAISAGRTFELEVILDSSGSRPASRQVPTSSAIQLPDIAPLTEFQLMRIGPSAAGVADAAPVGFGVGPLALAPAGAEPDRLHAATAGASTRPEHKARKPRRLSGPARGDQAMPGRSRDGKRSPAWLMSAAPFCTLRRQNHKNGLNGF